MRVVGIDPGLTGAIAMINTDSIVNAGTYQVHDMPVLALETGKNKKQVNSVVLFDLLKHLSPDVIYLEHVHAMSGQGVTSMFSFGCGFGIVQGVIGSLKIPMYFVSPAKWKKQMGLTGKDKDLARTKAQQFYPEAELSRKKDIGRADALLIAKYGWMLEAA